MLLSFFTIFVSIVPVSSMHIQNVLANQSPSSLPNVDSEKLQLLVAEDALKARARALYEASRSSIKSHGNPTRVIGLPGHQKTIAYILDELRSFGDYYNVTVEPFEAVDGHVKLASLLVNGVQPKSLASFGLTPPTANEKPIYGKLVAGGLGCDASDFGTGAKDNVVLLRRGQCSFGEKLRQAGLVGALGIVVYDPDSKNLQLHGTLGEPNKIHVPSVLVLGDEGLKYESLIKNKLAVEVSLYVDSYVRKIRTLNVIAETREGDHNNVVVLGAHSDSVAEGPGINDDGSGTISLLEVASQLRKFKVQNAVRFGWFSAEEEGLIGLSHYAAHLLPQENAKVRVFMDYDMMASPNFEYQVYEANNKDHPAGLAELKQLYIDYYLDHKLNYTLIPFDGRSDYVGFVKAGIPAGGIATGAEGVKDRKGVARFGGKAGKWFDPCYHQRCDDLLNPNYGAWLVNTRLIAHSVATYGASLKDFPVRENLATQLKNLGAGFTYRGHLPIV